jgi:hypothetical protein
MTRVLCRICDGEGCRTCGRLGFITPKDLAKMHRGPKSLALPGSVGAIKAFRETVREFGKATNWRLGK